MSKDDQVPKRDDARISRRAFARRCAGCAAAISAFVSGCAAWFESSQAPSAGAVPDCHPTSADPDTFDYIVVGSGAGGGPLAARLALAGFRVLLLEAGGDDEPLSYRVPAYHTIASEDASLRMDYFVRHYADEAQQRRDDKYFPDKGGVLYPRSGTLGGCTAHHAMITVYPHNSDWDAIAAVTGDPSWRAEHMRGYFERLERCEYVKHPGGAGDDPARHGYDGWLTTSVADPRLLLKDPKLTKMSLSAADQVLDDAATGDNFFARLWERTTTVVDKLATRLDPNDWRRVQAGTEGVCMVPLSVAGGRRVGTRELVRGAQRACPHNLEVRLHCLVTRVLLDDGQRAIGVSYQQGERLYRTDRESSARDVPAPVLEARASREVILAAGAFNSPQLLMLSGIGPPEELREHGIDVKVPLPGVGRNLQDRYEVGVLAEMDGDMTLLEGATFREPAAGDGGDPHFADWRRGKGVYCTNGAVTAVVTRSGYGGTDPDLFVFGLAGYFRGYYPGYSEEIRDRKDVFTWAVLKGHTSNRGGRVRLRSADPRDPPDINFHYFEEGTDRAGEDLEAVVDGIEYARRINAEAGDVVRREILPGAEVRTREQLRQFVRDNAWGHHASCTCKMGPVDDPMAVVDSGFRVHGTLGLRVVDASVFPSIPGFFIVTAVYMVSEKASDVILTGAGRAPDPPGGTTA